MARFADSYCNSIILHSTPFDTIAEATMGVEASKLLAIDMLDGLHGSGVDVPLTEDDCFNKNGEIDDEKFEEYLMQEDNEDEVKRKLLLALTNMVGAIGRKRKRDAMEDHIQRHMRTGKKTRVARSRWYTDPVTRVKRKKTPKMSVWWEDYIQDPQPDNKHWTKEFRRNFRLPYASYVMLLDMISSEASDGLFDRWIKAYERKNNKKNKKVSPIELLLLGSLRYLGRGWTFDDMKDVTYISRDVHRKFFHQFVKFGAKVLYPMYVSAPRAVEELRKCEREYNIAGFPGCIGSTDATHIPLEKVCMSMRQAHLGHKSKVTMRTYNLTCNHRRKILHTTEGHPARWNDKTLIRFDNFMSELRDGALNEKFDFELRTRQGMTIDDDGEDRTLKLRGAYVIVDNGYLEWSTTVPPLKASCNRSELRFSQWLESMRKDVECTFGILKGRWRILKSGIRLYNTEIADNIWLTCCALHNMLLDVDGLSKSWNNGVRSRWELERGEFGAEDIPFAIHRLVDPTGTEEFRLRQYDRSRFGYQRPPTQVSDNEEEDNDGGDERSENDDDNRSSHQRDDRGRNRRIGRNHSNATASSRIRRGRIESGTAVNELNFFQFRSLLIDNFNIRFHENNVQWPRRLAHSTPRHVPISD